MSSQSTLTDFWKQFTAGPRAQERNDITARIDEMDDDAGMMSDSESQSTMESFFHKADGTPVSGPKMHQWTSTQGDSH